MTQQLPDIYETRQARAILEALQAGDVKRAAQLENHLLAEAAEGPEEREAMRDQLRAAMLFRAQIDASEAGDEAAARYQTILTQTCSEKVIRTLISSALLHAGLERGELPADKHDLLTQYLDENGVGAELKSLAARIIRLA
ncbi:hypothetical protein ACFWBM_38990 [Streptomyces sp. NPDC059980]|uniref:hypothetical protein n=1 Tax=Streptomyces sp. NPDC059980 TaxID=3347022 RepID=UPI0036A56782